MTEPTEGGWVEPVLGDLAERAIEVLITHNEPVSREDLACALGVTGAHAWSIASMLRTLGYATVDDSQATVEATARAADAKFRSA